MKIFNAKIYTMDSKGTVIENGWIEISDGKISKVGSGTTQVSSADTDAGGRILIPGFIDAHTHLGIVGDGVGFESDDCNEQTDPVTPHIMAADGINPFDRCFEEARSRGITSVLSSPGSANAIGGVICAIKTNGRKIERMLIKEAGIKFALGENPKTAYNDRDETPVTRMATAGLIREHLSKAKKYAEDVLAYENDNENNDLPEFDAKLEATLPLIKKEQKAHFHCHRADDILTAVRISKKYDLDYVLIHTTEGHLIADLLAEDGACAVVGPLICDRSKPELANHTIKTAAELHRHGVTVAICTDHPVVPIQYLPLNAAAAVKGGLDYDEALRAITINAARIAGISDTVGSIEPGKDADIQLYSSDPLDLMSEPELVMINGELIINNLH
ncbi:MAG: amidohydrolase [Ruminococcus sp.]|nr:amidohydrolase [Ruminococcus sp.]